MGAYCTATDNSVVREYSIFTISLVFALISLVAAYVASIQGFQMLFLLGTAALNATVCLISGEESMSSISKMMFPVGLISTILALSAAF